MALAELSGGISPWREWSMASRGWRFLGKPNSLFVGPGGG